MRAEPEGLAPEAADAPLPWRTWKSSAGAISIPRLAPYSRIARASGCALRASSAAARSISSCSLCPSKRDDLDHGRLPPVNVPVLSNAMALSLAGCST